MSEGAAEDYSNIYGFYQMSEGAIHWKRPTNLFLELWVKMAYTYIIWGVLLAFCVLSIFLVGLLPTFFRVW